MTAAAARAKIIWPVKKPRARTQRREAERALDKTNEARERLFELEPGGDPRRAIPIVSPALVEVQAQSVPCPGCGGQHEIEEHLAAVVRGVRLREARLRCRQCNSRRSLWFKIADTRLN